MNSFIDGSSLLASSSASSSDNPTEGHFVPGKASDTITPANTNIVLDEVMQSMAGGQIDQSSSATPQVSKAGVSSVAIPTPHQPFKATSLQTGASGQPFSRRINDSGTLITTTPLKRVISGIPKDGDRSPKKPKQGDSTDSLDHEEDHQVFFFFQKLNRVKITSHTSTWKNQTGVLKAIFPVKGSPAQWKNS